MASQTLTYTIPTKETGAHPVKASEGVQNPNAGGQENAGGNDTCQNATAVGQESGSEYNISGTIEGAGMVGLVTGGTNTVTNSATPGKQKAQSSQEPAGGNAKDGQEAAGANANGGRKAIGHETGSVYNIRPQILGAGIVGVVSGGTNTVEHSIVNEVEDNKESHKGDQEAADGNNTGGGKSVGQNV